MSIWEECRDYKPVGAGVAKASLGPGAKTKDGDVLLRVLIIPGTMSPGSVTIYDGASDTGTVIFVGGATSAADLKSFYVDLNIRAKNAANDAGGPRWLITTGANVTVIAVGTFH